MRTRLLAVGQLEAARAALQSAYQLLSRRAEKINDPTGRQSFLEQVPLNREIVRAFEQWNAGSNPVV